LTSTADCLQQMILWAFHTSSSTHPLPDCPFINHRANNSDVKAGLEARLTSMKNFSLYLEHLTSILLTWPWKCAKIILVISISWLYHCNIHYKEVVKHTNIGQKFSYVLLLALLPCVLIQTYLHVDGLDLGLVVLASTSASEFWPWHFGLV